MTSQTGKQIVTIQILPNISQRKGNQATAGGQLIEYTLRNIFFFKNHAKNEAGKLVPDFFVFQKSFV